MVKPTFFLFALGLLVSAAHAQQGRDERVRTVSESQASAPEQDAQRRRAALRAAVQTRPDSTSPADAAAPYGRQLSRQELTLLREQLRQQRGSAP